MVERGPRKGNAGRICGVSEARAAEQAKVLQKAGNGGARVGEV